MKNRIFIERSIYYNSSKDEYMVISYSKETKKTKTLYKSNKIGDCQYYRDNNLRYAEFGKGIRKRLDKYDAVIYLKNNKRATNFTIGTFDTPEEAVKQRKLFIESLF